MPTARPIAALPDRDLSIIVPVWRESPIINDQLSHLERLDGAAGVEIIVVDGRPEADTLSVITSRRVKGVVAAKGRGMQMNGGARIARGQWLLFLHADTRLPPNGITLVKETMARPGIAGGAFQLGIDSPRPAYRWIEAAVRLRSRLTRIPYGDQAIFIKRDVFWRLGGYDASPLMEDVTLMRRLKRRGYRIRMLAASVSTSARRWEVEGVVRCTLRNWILIVLHRCGVPVRLLAAYYRS